jgi:hypothetical protein
MTVTSGKGGGADFVAAFPCPVARSPIATVTSRIAAPVQYVRRHALDFIALVLSVRCMMMDVMYAYL